MNEKTTDFASIIHAGSEGNPRRHSFASPRLPSQRPGKKVEYDLTRPSSKPGGAGLNFKEQDPGQDFDFLVLIGRFCLLHLGHEFLLNYASKRSKRVILLVGSSRRSRTEYVPFTFEERRRMILSTLSEDQRDRVDILPVVDRYNETEWMRDVTTIVSGVVAQHNKVPGRKPKIGVIGHVKDHTSAYLRRLRSLGELVEMPFIDQISATPIRQAYFKNPVGALQEIYRDQVSEPVRAFLLDFAKTPHFAYVADEIAWIEDHKARWANTPYPVIFTTVDAVVLYGDQVLMVKRRSHPGKGLTALPGGYVNQYETLKDSMLRELREETGIKLPMGILEGAIRGQQVFDYPYRSTRGRIITHAFLIDLKVTDEGRPKVRGGDDAEDAFWLPLSDVDPEQMFEDHYHIFDTMLRFAGTR
jgi:bifunctional NMN adenylyltransferase/nudix hydrolase